MKRILALSLVLLTVSCGQNSAESMKYADQITQDTGSDEVDTDEGVFTPEQEEEFLKTHIPGTSKARAFKFAQTKWLECDDYFTGNYYGFNCTNKRVMAVILKDFLDDYSYKCVNEALTAQGGGQVADLHIVHVGISGDPNHSPKSMHAENRAIDIKSMEVKLTSGQVKNFVYEGTTNRNFYTAFRKCWGKVVHDFNGCPYYKESSLLTGSIGWENENHQRHMHMSVPYCVNGAYSSYYYKK